MVTAQHEGLNKIATRNLEYTRDMLRALFDLPVPKSGAARLASPDLSEADPGVCRADSAILYGSGEENLIAEGEVRGELKGSVRRGAEAVLEVLEARGLPVPEHVRQRITGCEDPGLLREWHIRAVTVVSAEDVFG
ncbi:hypothetical protein WBK31_27450 [Nonomuraea sp. N2-4H]|uniref:hypothetical protein n=1 Tax=unclassified Nonomuraea TaxID=2593643 RepID=UPI00324763CB